MDTGPLKVQYIQCNYCVHQRSKGIACNAFPDRIPDDILRGQHNHTKPYPGDHGIRFEQRKKTED